MTLQQLLYFRTAAQLGSFNAAARALHCTQPAVSDQVRRLESELGVSLFARAGRGLTLTSAGRVFLSHAERVTEAADDALVSVGRRHAARERVVTMGTFRNAPYYEIAELATRYCDRNPDARLRMRGQNSYDVARAVQEGELEAGLVVLPVDDSLLEVRSLFRDEVLFVSRDPSLTREPAGVAVLATSPLILYDITHGFNDPTRRQLAARAQEAGVLLEPRIEVEHVETALQLVGRGLGATIAARAVLARSSVPEGVTAVRFAEPFYDFFAVVTRRGVRVSPATKGLLDLVDEWAETVAARL
ncbi:MAG TPA: LysR family transcriptional regulator [Solirubrobacteraceae bacterium]